MDTMIPCIVSQGFFESEFYVSVGDSSAFVDHSVLKLIEAPIPGAEGHGLLQVFVVGRQGTKVLIEIPGEPVVGSPRAWVDSTLLQEGKVAA